MHRGKAFSYLGVLYQSVHFAREVMKLPAIGGYLKRLRVLCEHGVGLQRVG